jgi:hypothetical protein
MTQPFHDLPVAYKLRNLGYNVAIGFGFDLSQCSGGFLSRAAGQSPPRLAGETPFPDQTCPRRTAASQPAPGTQAQAGALLDAWVKTGAVCPN